MECASAAIEYAHVGEAAGLRRTVFVWIIHIVACRRALRPSSINQDVLIPSLKTSSLDDLTLDRDIAEAFTEKVF